MKELKFFILLVLFFSYAVKFEKKYYANRKTHKLFKILVKSSTTQIKRVNIVIKYKKLKSKEHNTLY